MVEKGSSNSKNIVVTISRIKSKNEQIHLNFERKISEEMTDGQTDKRTDRLQNW